jgi:CO dehydrogenase/acetyl-CoA synthase beta subunit
MKMKLILDRIEKTQNGKIVAVFEGNNALYNITEANMPNEFINSLEVGMIIEAEIVENKLISPKFLYEETENKRKEMNKRLSNLFNRKKSN